ncbi:MAG: dTDP-4-dehydrorhamnose 3,5-epimerase [Hyphomicrobiaceae bacterium]
MKFDALPLPGAWLIKPEPYLDDRGRFARSFCIEEFRAHGLETHFPQHSIALTRTCGTVRGMHFQEAPHEEIKLVQCVAGAIYDVIIDLRPDSPTFGEWMGFELSAENGRQIYVPKGFAHGCQSLTDSAAMLYLISTPYEPAAASGVCFDDPAFGIAWPLPPSKVADKDRQWPAFGRKPQLPRGRGA